MNQRKNDTIILFLIIDLVILNIVVFLGVIFSPLVRSSEFYQIVLYFFQANLAWVITYLAFSKSNRFLREGFGNRAWIITRMFLIYIVITTTIVFFFLPHTYSKIFLIEYSLIFYIYLLAFYLLFYYVLKERRKRGLNVSKLLIVGYNQTAIGLSELVKQNTMLGYKFYGFISNGNVEDKMILGQIHEIESIIKSNKIDMIFLTLSEKNEEKRSSELLHICRQMGVRLRFIYEDKQLDYNRLDFDILGNMVMVNPLEIPLDNIQNRLIKRGFDLFFSTFFLLFVFSWLFVIIAIFIKLSSKGPVFFVQKRTGYNNKPFMCYKFRSMKVNINADIVQAKAGDNRITTIGKFLRKTNLDEFPQFINVFLGDMSVVGPRPHMILHTKEYSKKIDEYLLRHYVKPGVTGWAQVNGFRGETNELWKMEKRVEYDMEYIKKWNFWLDIEIIFKTIFDKKTYNNAG